MRRAKYCCLHSTLVAGAMGHDFKIANHDHSDFKLDPARGGNARMSSMMTPIVQILVQKNNKLAPYMPGTKVDLPRNSRL